MRTGPAHDAHILLQQGLRCARCVQINNSLAVLRAQADDSSEALPFLQRAELLCAPSLQLLPVSTCRCTTLSWVPSV